MAACGEFEVGGKKSADVFGDEQLAALARCELFRLDSRQEA
jgi:hypothetical protein